MKSIFARVLSLLLVAIVVTSALVSCNSSGNGGGETSASITTEATTPEVTKRPIVTKDPSAANPETPSDPENPENPDNPDEPAVVGKYLEDFETSSLSETGKLVTTTSEVIGMIAPGTSDGSGTPELVNDPAGGTNKVLKFTSLNGGKYFFMLPNNKATKTAVSFDLYNEDFDASTQTTMGVKYNADVSAESSFFAALQNVYCRFYDNGLNDSEVATQTNAGRDALSNGVWYTVVMERDGNTVRAVIYEKENPKAVKYDKTFTFSADLCASINNDYSRVAIERGGGSAKGIVYIDNLFYVDLEKYPDDNPNQAEEVVITGKYVEDFETSSLLENGNLKTTTSEVTGAIAPGTPAQSGTPEIVDDPAGGTNKVMKFTSSNGGRYLFTLPNNKATKTSVSFDFYFEDFDEATQTTMGVKYIADSVSAESSFFAAIQNVYCRFYDAGINDADVIAQTNAGKSALSNGVWYTVVIERDGSTLKVLIFEKENPETVKYDKTFTFTRDLTTSNNEFSRIVIERGGGSAKGIVYIDNISYTDLEKNPPAAAE